MKGRAYEDDSAITEVIVLRDGRIYAFGLSPEVEEALRGLREEWAAAAGKAELVLVQDEGGSDE